MLPFISHADMGTAKRIVVFIPFDGLTGAREGPGDVNTSVRVAVQGVRALLVLAYLAENPWLGTEAGNAEANEVAPELRTQYMQAVTPTGESHTAARVVVHFELVMKADGVTPGGARYYFDRNDVDVDFDRGIDNIILKNDKAATKPKSRNAVPPKPWETWMGVSSRSVWRLCFLSALSLCNDTSAELRPFFGKDPQDQPNPASLYERLGLDYAIESTTNAADYLQSQIVPANYKGVDAQGNTTMVFPRPDLVWQISPSQVSPRSFLETSFPHVVSPGLAPIPRTLTDEQRLVEEYLRNAEGISGTMSEVEKGKKSTDRLAEAAVKTLAAIDTGPGTDAEKSVLKSTWAQSTATMADFVQAITGGGANKVITKNAQWLVQNMEESASRGEAFSLMLEERIVDPDLSAFGNFLADFMNTIEVSYGVKTAHAEVMKIYFGVHSAYWVNKSMKINFLLSGAAMTGKSYVANLIRRRLIPPGIVTSVSRKTKRADEVSTDQDNQINFTDEADARFLGVDDFGRAVGVGDSTVKEAMTEQELTTETCVVGEDGQRTKTICVAKMNCSYWANTNLDASCLPDAITSRWYCHNFPEVARPFHDFQEKLYAMDLEKGVNSDATRAADFRYQRLSVLVCIVEQLIYTKRLPEPSLLVARAVFLKMSEDMDKRGVDTQRSARNFERLFTQAREMTIFNAVHTIFGTQTVFPVNKAFEFKDLMAVAPYLVCTEEIAVYVMTAFLDMFIDTRQAGPVRDLVRSKCFYDADRVVTVQTAFKSVNNVMDYNYFMINNVRPRSGFNNESHSDALAGMMAQEATRGAGSFSRENLVGIIKALETSAMEGDVYNADGALVPDRKMTFKHLVFNREKNAVYLSRAYVNAIFAPDYDQMGELAVRAYEHRHIQPRRIVTGLTYLTPTAPETVIAPHILRCIDLQRNQRALIIPNASGVDFTTTARQPPPVYDVDGDLEAIEFTRHLRRCFVTPGDFDAAVEALPAAGRARLRERGGENAGTYPGLVLATYIGRERAKKRKMKENDAGAGAEYSKTIPDFDDGLREAVAAKRQQVG